MDRVLLKRLLGAGVIVALAVIVLPFILQGEGYQASLSTNIPARPQPPQPLDTAIPEPAADVREQLQAPPPLPMPMPGPGLGPAPRIEPAAAADAPKAEVRPQEAKPQDTKPREVKLPEPKPEARPAPKVEPKPEGTTAPAKSQPQVQAPATSAKPVTEPAAGKPAPAAAPAKVEPAAKPAVAGQWLIQLGSFSAENNAQTLRGQVQRAGVPCLIEPLDIDGRKVWRVRAGPFASQAAADAALKRLQGGLKLGGMVMQIR